MDFVDCMLKIHRRPRLSTSERHVKRREGKRAKHLRVSLNTSDPCVLAYHVCFGRCGSYLERRLYTHESVVGRITEKHLDEAEKTFPGIAEMYEALTSKPATFLQLVWIYEASLTSVDGAFALA